MSTDTGLRSHIEEAASYVKPRSGMILGTIVKSHDEHGDVCLQGYVRSMRGFCKASSNA